MKGWHGGIAMALVLGLAACRSPRRPEPAVTVPLREDGAIALKVMSFNVRYENTIDPGERAWRQRVIGVVRLIGREQADVIGVQEALHGQAADLRASLPDYEFFGIGRTDGLRAGEYAGLFYRKNRFRPDPGDCGTFWLSDRPSEPGSRTWGNEIPRIAAWVRLIDAATGRGFYVFNTHWDHRSQIARERSALLMARRIDARRHPDEPVVLTGDFNTVETNPAMRYLTGARAILAGSAARWPSGLTDVYQELHPQGNRRTLHLWRGSREGSLKVDFILASRGARAGAAAIVTGDVPFVSDHFPVTASLVFPREARPAVVGETKKSVAAGRLRD